MLTILKLLIWIVWRNIFIIRNKSISSGDNW